MHRVLATLAAWRGAQVAVNVEWQRHGGRLVHLAGVLGEATTREEPDLLGDDPRVFATLPVGDVCWLAFDSHAIVESESRPAALTLQLHDDLQVTVAVVG